MWVFMSVCLCLDKRLCVCTVCDPYLPNASTQLISQEQLSALKLTAHRGRLNTRPGKQPQTHRMTHLNCIT